MTVCNSIILAITQNILETMAHMGVCEGEAEPSLHEESMTGCVQISGTWRGAVVLKTTKGFVKHAACEMFDVADSAVTAVDMEDTLAEITNMIGGNIKSQVPSPSYLSLPSVTTGHDFNFRLNGAVVVCQMPMISHDHPLTVLICEAQE